MMGVKHCGAVRTPGRDVGNSSASEGGGWAPEARTLGVQLLGSAGPASAGTADL